MDILLVADTDLVREELASILVETSEVDEVVGLRGGQGRDAIATKDVDVWRLGFQLSGGTASDLLEERDVVRRQGGRGWVRGGDTTS